MLDLNKNLNQLIKAYQSKSPKCDKCPSFEEEIRKSEIKIKSLEIEIQILKENEDTRREKSIKKCTSLLNENKALKSQVQQLSITVESFQILKNY